MAKMYFPGRFEGKVALVNGVGRGSTKEAAVRMAAEGADVVLTDIVPAIVEAAGKECAAHGRKVIASATDVTNMDQMKALVERANKELGKIDILVHGAVDVGELGGPLRVFVETEEAEWRKKIDISYIGFLIACKLIVPGMCERKYGRVVGIATDASRVGSMGEALEGGARAAMMGLSKTLAREVARYAVCVNIVAPGPHLTPVVKDSMAGQDPEFFNKVIGAMTKAVALKRMGEPDEIAAGTCFLASDDASFITGQTLSVSGGLTMC